MTAYLPQDWGDVQAALIAWAAAEAPGATVVWSPSDGPRPERPLVRLSVLSSPLELGQPEHHGGALTDDDLLERHAFVPVHLVIGVQVFTDDGSAETVAQALRASLDAEDVADTLQAVSLAKVEASPTINLDAISGGRHEQRRAFDVTFRAHQRTTRELDWIETVNLGPAAPA